MRQLLERDDPAARLAVEIFTYRVRKYVGAYLAVLEGAEAIVFTGGIGERSAEIRRRVCEPLGWAGMALDSERNQRGDQCISADSATLRAWIVQADEENGDASIIVAAFVVNELKDNDRPELLRNLIGNQERGTRNGGRRVLIIEPISQRISPWWDQWAAEFIKRGGRADVWKARIAPPPMVKRLAKASGLRPEMLTAKSLFL